MRSAIDRELVHNRNVNMLSLLTVTVIQHATTRVSKLLLELSYCLLFTLSKNISMARRISESAVRVMYTSGVERFSSLVR